MTANEPEQVSSVQRDVGLTQSTLSDGFRCSSEVSTHTSTSMDTHTDTIYFNTHNLASKHISSVSRWPFYIHQTLSAFPLSERACAFGTVSTATPVE